MRKKLTDSQVADVKTQLNQGISVKFLARIYEVSESLIKKIGYGYRN